MEGSLVCSEVGQAFRLVPSGCSQQMMMAFVSEPALLPVTLFWDRKDFPFPRFLTCAFAVLDFSKVGKELKEATLFGCFCGGKPRSQLFAPVSSLQPVRGAGMLQFLLGLDSAAGSSSVSAVVVSPVIGT